MRPVTCHRLALLALGTIFLLSSTAACDRNTEKFVAGEKPRPPDLARIFPEEDPSAQRAGEAPQMPAAPGGGAPPMAGRMPAPAGGGPSAEGGNISGTITVAPALEGSLPAGAMLFVIARPAGVTGGPPLAVLRIPSPHFPLPFEIGPANVMIPSMRFQGDIEITARLDSDGNAMTRTPGDLSGATRETHRPGATGVSIVLDQKT